MGLFKREPQHQDVSGLMPKWTDFVDDVLREAGYRDDEVPAMLSRTFKGEETPWGTAYGRTEDFVYKFVTLNLERDRKATAALEVLKSSDDWSLDGAANLLANSPQGGSEPRAWAKVSMGRLAENLENFRAPLVALLQRT